MKKIIIMLLSTLFAMAIELPQSINASVTAVNNEQITIDQSVPKGMSGIVVHNYGNGIAAITHTVNSNGGNSATLQPYKGVEHDNLPKIKSSATTGDKVVFGNFYDNALLIAPSEKIYSTLTASIDKNWIHPDIYAMHLLNEDETKITLENLKAFATFNQVGLIVIVTQTGLSVLDPLSGQYLMKQPYSLTTDTVMSPFYARFEQISDTFWGNEEKQAFAQYYHGVESIR